MIDSITTLLKNNNFASGGLLLLFGGSLIGVFYKVYGYATILVKTIFFTSFTIESSEAFFDHVQYWLYKQNYTQKYCTKFQIRKFHVKDDDAKNSIVPDYGTHFFLIGWRPTFLSFSRIQKENLDLKYLNINVFRIFSKAKFIDSFIKEVDELWTNVPY